MRPVRLAVIAFAILYFGTNLKSSILQVPTDTWQSTYNMSSARANAVAVLLPDGRIVFAGGAGADGQATTTAEAMSSDGTSSALPAMGAARSGHAAIYTLTGDLLVTGGRTSGGGIVNSAEVFDSLSNTWSSLPTQMVDTRTGHTMSQLPDGNILIAGGENSSGPIAALEIYDIGTRSFRFAGTLTTARKAHAAAVLNDGRVLIVGGTTLLPGGNSATLSSTEIYDPVTGSVSAGPNLATPRAGATATTLLDGRVLVTGGSYPEAAQQPPELASAEIYDPATGSFAASASRLSTARTGHQAFLLPNNNNVLIAGGSSAGADLASAELYCPWNDTFQPTTSMSAARSAAAGSALGKAVGDGGDIGVDGMLVVGGGHNLNRADVYGFAWVKTDHTNYAPGSVVTITGSGWQPGETVTLSFLKSPRLDTPPALTAVADANGNIFNNQFSPGEHDLNVRVYLTAAGSQSGVQAQNTFTTSIKLYEATIAPTSDTAGHQSAPYTLTITNDPTSTNQLGSATITVPSGYLNVVLGRITQPPAGNFWAAALSGNQITLAAIGSSKMPPGQSVSLALTATAPCTAGPYQWSTTAGNFTLVGPQPLVTVTGSCSIGTITTVASSASPSIYGQGVTFTATVAPNTGSTAPTGTVQFTIDGVAFGSPVTLSASGSNGVANSGSTSTLPVSGSPHSIAANYTPTGNFTGSTGSLQQTVNPAPLTITANNSSKTYGQTVTFAGTEFTASGLVNGDTVTSVTLTSTGAPATAAVGPYPIVPSAATGGTFVASNYTITYVNGTLTVNPAPLTITANSSSKTYGQTVTFAGTEFTASGLVNGDTVTSVTLTSTGAPATAAVGPYPIVPSAATGGTFVASNYTITYVNGTLTVNPAPLTITANSSSKTYGQTVTFAGSEFSSSGLVNGDTVTSVTLTSTGAAATATVGPYPIVPSAATGTGLTNYTITYANGTLTVNPAPLTITANSSSKTYGQTVTFAGTEFTASGLVNGDTVTSVTLTSTGAPATAAVGPYPIVPSAATGTGLTNYTITYANGTLTVSPAPLTITANSSSKTYGQTVTFAGTEFTTSGLVNGDRVTSVTLTSSGAAATATVGPYPIVPSAAMGTGLGSYTITYVNGTLTVNPASLTITANSTSKTYGQTLIFLGTEFTSSGLVNGDTVTTVTLTSDGAASGAAPGYYPIVPSAAVGTGLGNYAITYVNGTLTVTPALAGLKVGGGMYNLGFGSASVTCFDGSTDTKNNCVKKWIANNLNIDNTNLVSGSAVCQKTSTTTCVSYFSSVPYLMTLYGMRDAVGAGYYEKGVLHFTQDTGFTFTTNLFALDQFDWFYQTNAYTEGISYYVPSQATDGVLLKNGSTYTDVTQWVYSGKVATVAYSAGVFMVTGIAAENFSNVGTGKAITLRDFTTATFLNGKTVTVTSNGGSPSAPTITFSLTCPSNCTGSNETGYLANARVVPAGQSLLIGYMEPFDLINVKLAVAQSGGSVTYQYSKGSGVFGDLTAAPHWSDGTGGLANDGQIIFYPPTDWATDTIGTGTSQLGSAKAKFWVKITPTSASMQPTIFSLRGDNQRSTLVSSSQCGTVTGCMVRGWSASAYAASTACGGSPCVVAGGYQYNPSPPSTASARFIYQARTEGYGGYGNETWLNPSTNDGSGNNIVGTLMSALWAASTTAFNGGVLPTQVNGSFFDNAASNIPHMYPSWNVNLTDLACAPSCPDMSGNSAWDDYWATAFARTQSLMHATYGSSFKVTGNVTANWPTTLATVGVSLDFSWLENPQAVTAPGNFNSGSTTAQNTWDMGSSGVPVILNQTDNNKAGYCDTNYTPCIPFTWNRATRGAMNALGNSYIFGNPNALPYYSLGGMALYDFADQYWYFTNATTLTAAISRGVFSSQTINVASTSLLTAMTSATCVSPGCGGTDNPYSGNTFIRICPTSGGCVEGDIFQITVAGPTTATITANTGSSVAIANNYTGTETVQIAKYGHMAYPSGAMPAWTDVMAYGTAPPAFHQDIGTPDTVNGWQPPSGNCGYASCHKGDRDMFYGTACTTLHCSAQQWSGLPCLGGTYHSPLAGGASRDCSPLARRDYIGAIVLMRTARTGGTLPSAPEEWTTPSHLIDMSSFETRCAPSCVYYRLRPDGTTDPGTSSLNLRGAETAIMMKTPVTH